MPNAGSLGLEDLPVDKKYVPRWWFELGQPLLKLELVKRPGDFAIQKEKVVRLQFIDIYEIYHLDVVNTDLMMAWCL
jgi:hypothetical protein